jgi:UDP:flavonoid glycosyltransferase YjiC (YdhE family)
MRALFTVHPGLGHLHPMVPLARALEVAGHEVLFATAPSFAPLVTALGLQAVGMGLDWRIDDVERDFPEIGEREGPERSSWVMRHVFAGVDAQRLIPDALELAAQWRPDVIVRNVTSFGASIVAELLDIPDAVCSHGFRNTAEFFRTACGDVLAERRAEYGLDPDPDCTLLHRYLYFEFAPSIYQFSGIAPMQTAHGIRPPIFDRSADETIPLWLAELPDQPTVYVTLGTVFNRVPDVFEALLEGLADEPVNVIATIGRNRHVADFGPQPENVHVARYIPQSLLFGACDAVVTSAGFNTVMTALDAGLPLVLVPLGADQPLHAARCVDLGVGIEVGQPVQPEAVRDAVRTVLAEPSYRAAAQTLQAEIAALPPVERAVELLEQLAVTRAPLVATTAT